MESNEETNYRREVKYGGCGNKTPVIKVTALWELEIIVCPIEIFYFSNVPTDEAIGISLN